ncbi:MAG: hypothetical protein AB7U20_07645 [Planctomycetaceae bacterium]
MHVSALLIVMSVLGQAEPAPAPARLGAEKVAELRVLIRDTELRDIELQAELKDLQAALTDAYATYDLDGEQIMRLQQKIAVTQNELLLNYHRLQVGFRRICGPERFPQIKARIDNYLETTEQRRAKEAEHADSPAKQQPTSQPPAGK